MPCLRKRHPKTEDCCSDAEQADSDDTGFFLQVLKRVSVLSSTIIRYLNEIRTDILQLFGPCINQYDSFNADQDMGDTTVMNNADRNGRRVLVPRRWSNRVKPRKNAFSEAVVCGGDDSGDADRIRLIDCSTDTSKGNDAHTLNTSPVRTDGSGEAYTNAAFEPDLSDCCFQTQTTCIKTTPRESVADIEKQSGIIPIECAEKLLREFFDQLDVIFIHEIDVRQCKNLLSRMVTKYLIKHGPDTDDSTKQELFGKMRARLDNTFIRYRSQGRIKDRDAGSHGADRVLVSATELQSSWKPNRASEARRKHIKHRTSASDANNPLHSTRGNKRQQSVRPIFADADIAMPDAYRSNAFAGVAKTVKGGNDSEMTEAACKQWQTPPANVAARPKVPELPNVDPLELQYSPRPEKKKTAKECKACKPAPSNRAPATSNPAQTSSNTRHVPSNARHVPSTSRHVPSNTDAAPSGSEPIHSGKEPTPSSDDSEAASSDSETEEVPCGTTQGAQDRSAAGEAEDSSSASALVPQAQLDVDEVPLLDPRAMLVNRHRIVRILHTLSQFCLDFFLAERWEYRMILAAKVHTRPSDGASDWNPLYNDFLYKPKRRIGRPGVAESRIASFDRHVSIDPDMEFIGLNPAPERLCEVLRGITVRTTLTDIRRNGMGALQTTGQVDELRWCTDMMDVLTYISYYILIGPCHLVMCRTEQGDQAAIARKVVAVRDHVVTTFERSISAMTPRMLHAIDNFLLEEVTVEYTPSTPPPPPQPQNDTVPAQQEVKVDFAPPPPPPRPDDKVPEQPVLQVHESPVQTCSSSPLQMPEEDAPPVPAPPKQAKKKGRNTKRKLNRSCTGPQSQSVTSAAGGDTDAAENNTDKPEDAIETIVLAEETLTSRDVAGIDGKVTVEVTPVQQMELIVQLDNTVQISVDCGDCAEISADDIHLGDVDPGVTADVTQRDYSDYVTYIETNNTLNYSALEVVAGHGMTPNKKKLKGGIREKKKTKGVPNKHLEAQPKPERELYQCPDDNSDDAAQTGSDPTAAEISPDADQASTSEAPSEAVETKGDKPVAPLLVLDDREYNLVPEEVIRRDESKLRDLEQAYTVTSAEKKKDKHKKKKEKKSKGVRLQLDFNFDDTNRRY